MIDVTPSLNSETAEMTAAFAPLRVLVVDDEPLIRWALAETLSERGDIVMEAGTGERALRALKDSFRSPDVVLLDYCLPDSSGLSLLSNVMCLAPRSQVILMTADCTQDVADDALGLGAFCVTIKPFDMQRIAALVHQAYTSRPPLILGPVKE